MSVNSPNIPLMATSLPWSSVAVRALSQMKFGSTSMMTKLILLSSCEKEADRVVSLVQGTSKDVRVMTDGAEPQKRRTFELPNTSD